MTPLTYSRPRRPILGGGTYRLEIVISDPEKSLIDKHHPREWVCEDKTRSREYNSISSYGVSTEMLTTIGTTITTTQGNDSLILLA